MSRAMLLDSFFVLFVSLVALTVNCHPPAYMCKPTVLLAQIVRHSVTRPLTFASVSRSGSCLGSCLHAQMTKVFARKKVFCPGTNFKVIQDNVHHAGRLWIGTPNRSKLNRTEGNFQFKSSCFASNNRSLHLVFECTCPIGFCSLMRCLSSVSSQLVRSTRTCRRFRAFSTGTCRPKSPNVKSPSSPLQTFTHSSLAVPFSAFFPLFCHSHCSQTDRQTLFCSNFGHFVPPAPSPPPHYQSSPGLAEQL
jgi:hypothetical protein